MSKKLFLLVLASLLLLGGSVFAASPSAKNIIDGYGYGGSDGITPSVTIVRVRYARGMAGPEQNFSGLSSGDVVMWDSVSADGITISGCVVTAGSPRVPAGVLVTDIATTDTAAVNPFTGNKAGASNWGYMAIHGYCLGRVDTSRATTGGSLKANTGDGLEKTFATQDFTDVEIVLSNDVGILLRDDGADGLMPIYLY